MPGLACGAPLREGADQRGRTLRAQSAAAALAAAPDPVEPGLRGVEHPFVVGDDPHLEVAPSVAFGAESGPREVCAAQIKERPVDRDHLQVHPRARAHLEARLEARLAPRELFAKGTRRGGRVKQTNAHPSIAERLNRVEDRHVPPAAAVACADRGLHEELLHVGGGDPHRRLRLRDGQRHSVVVGAIDDERHDGAAGVGEREGGGVSVGHSGQHSDPAP